MSTAMRTSGGNLSLTHHPVTPPTAAARLPHKRLGRLTLHGRGPAPPPEHGSGRDSIGDDVHRQEGGLMVRTPLPHSPPEVEAGSSQTVSISEGAHALARSPAMGRSSAA